MSSVPDRPHARLGGVAEVAAELRISRQHVAKLRARDDFPAPIASLSVGEVWDLDAIVRWSGSGTRRGPGRPGRSAKKRVLLRRFVLERMIGGGGFALVYRARDLWNDGALAIKALQQVAALDGDLVARFERELELMSQLTHPNVLPVLDHGIDADLGLWYAMPLAGGSLNDDLLTFRDDVSAVAEVMRQVCSGLEYIHELGVLHRDLKPANILRTQQGTWAIADFGLARTVIESSVGLTSTAEAMGTAFYTAPEQWRDAKHVDKRADIFSVGKILQALITGSLPVDDNVPPGRLRPVILKAIDPARSRRYNTAVELLTAIEAALAEAPAKFETPEERAERLHLRLAGPRIADPEALGDIVNWAKVADRSDYSEMGHLAVTLSALSAESIEWWWERDGAGFARAFDAFSDRLSGAFSFSQCDGLADFAWRAVRGTGDHTILRRAIQGLAELGHYHNRWHVRDVAISVLQSIRDEEDAVAALEGLRSAGPDSVGWTVGATARRTLHPILRAGIAQIVDATDTSDG